MSQLSAAQLAKATQDALNRGALSEAVEFCRRLTAMDRSSPNGALFSGIIAYRQGRIADASAAFAEATELAPQAPAAWFWRGNAERERGDFAAASRCYAKALRLEPSNADAAYNLGLSLYDQSDWANAGAAFTQAGRLRPDNYRALRGVVNCAGALAGSDYELPDSLQPVERGHPPLLSFVVCSITPSKLEALRINLAEKLGNNPWELVHIADAQSLCDGYTRGTSLARGDALVFCHDDIEILDPRFHPRLLNALADADIVGVAGTTKIRGPSVAWAGQPHVHGWITHRNHPTRQANFMASISSLAPIRIDDAKAVDGLFIATYRHVVEQIGFDTEAFDGFHFYDLDFSYRAHLAGLRVRIQCDLLLTHTSRGAFDDNYRRYAERFLVKFPVFSNVPPADTPGLFEVDLASRAQVLRFYAWISNWLGRDP